MGIVEFLQHFNSDLECYRYLESKKWDDGQSCPHCGSLKFNSRKCGKRYKCKSCQSSYSVLKGTIFENSKLPLQKWFAAIHMILNAKKGLSSLQLAREIGVNKNTAWFLQFRIRIAMDEDIGTLSGVIEVDESHIGGSLENKHYYKKKKDKMRKTAGFSHKTTVLGLLERRGKIKVQVLNNGASGKEIQPIMQQTIDPKSKIVTDGYGAYYGLSKKFKKHIKINASKHVRNYGRYHTNSIEGFWSLIKRAIVGQYHQIAPCHVQKYVNEIAYKYNHRNDENIFNSFILDTINS